MLSFLLLKIPFYNFLPSVPSNMKFFWHPFQSIFIEHHQNFHPVLFERTVFYNSDSDSSSITFMILVFRLPIPNSTLDFQFSWIEFCNITHTAFSIFHTTSEFTTQLQKFPKLITAKLHDKIQVKLRFSRIIATIFKFPCVIYF